MRSQITLFASAYPLAALWSLANNVMEIRSDAFKLCMSFRRSRRPTSHGIGTWLYAFNALGYLSVMTNCAIFGLHSGLMDKLFPGLSFVGVLVGVAIMEHVMVAVKVCIEMLVPDTPSAVLEAQRVQRAVLRKKATLQVELSSRQLLFNKAADNNSTGDAAAKSSGESVEIDGVNITKEKVKEWMQQEHERRSKLEQEVKSLNELYMGWIREEQTKRKDAERRLTELQQQQQSGCVSQVLALSCSGGGGSSHVCALRGVDAGSRASRAEERADRTPPVACLRACVRANHFAFVLLLRRRSLGSIASCRGASDDGAQAHACR